MNVVLHLGRGHRKSGTEERVSIFLSQAWGGESLALLPSVDVAGVSATVCLEGVWTVAANAAAFEAAIHPGRFLRSSARLRRICVPRWAFSGECQNNVCGKHLRHR